MSVVSVAFLIVYLLVTAILARRFLLGIRTTKDLSSDSFPYQDRENGRGKCELVLWSKCGLHSQFGKGLEHPLTFKMVTN